MTRALLIACLAAGGVEAEAGFPASDEALT